MTVALVTGASRGIGRCVAEMLLQQGRRVIACGRDANALESLRSQHLGQVWPLVCDLGAPGAADVCFAQALSLAGQIDELVYAAGVVAYQNVGHIDEAALRAQHEVNFISAFVLGQHVGTHMRARGQGAMVFVGSTLALVPAPSTAAYASSKAALFAATRAFALELAPAVRVNALAPGVVETDMVRAPRPGDPSDLQTPQARLEALARLHPLGRLGHPQDVAAAALYLLNAPWVTGSVLTVDGGLSLR